MTEIFNQAADEGFHQSVEPDEEFRKALRHNNAVFAAFKTHRMQNDMAAQLLDSNGNLKPFEQWKNDVQSIASHQCRSWLETEYNTAVLRAHQAADWQQFLQEADVLPNLKWMPSTSPNPGADHMPFWGTILPIDDPFWDQHRPGDRWNCKCSLTSTDEPTTPVPSVAVSQQPKNTPQRGLENNPGKDAAVFSDKHPYFPKSCNACPFYKPGFKARLRHLVQNRKKNCMGNCSYVNSAMRDAKEKNEKSEQKRIEENRKLYDKLSKDKRYKDVEFNPETGALKATHLGHNDGHDQGFILERKLIDSLYNCGHSIILCDEQKKGRDGNRLVALDMILDGVRMDIKSITKNKPHYGSAIGKKNEQLVKFNARSDVHNLSDSLCIYFDDPTMYSPEKITKGYEYMQARTTRYIQLKHIVCIVNSAKGLEIKTFDFS